VSASAIAAPGLGAYQLNPWALPYLASALLLLGLSLRLARSPRPVDQAFILNMLPVWLTELAIVPLGCARTAEAAFLWSRIANAASGFVGPASLHLVVVAVGWSRQLRWTRVGFLGAAAALAALDLCSHLTISSVWRTQYAWSGRAGPLFPVHMLLIAGSMIPALAVVVIHAAAQCLCVSVTTTWRGGAWRISSSRRTPTSAARSPRVICGAVSAARNSAGNRDSRERSAVAAIRADRLRLGSMAAALR